jgi:hypothetical protein
LTIELPAGIIARTRACAAEEWFMIRRFVFACMCLLLMSPVVAARGAGPSSAPSAGNETPAQGLKAYNAGIRAEDSDAMLGRIYAAGADEQRLARAMVRTDVCMGRLLKATRDKFGDAGLKKMAAAVGDASDEDIDAAPVTIDGDHAVIKLPIAGYAMVRDGGRWKIDASSLLIGSGERATAAADRIAALGSRAQVLADAVAAGKYKSVDDVIEKFKSPG